MEIRGPASGINPSKCLSTLSNIIITLLLFTYTEIQHTQSVGFPLSPPAVSPGGHSAVPLSPRYSLNLSGVSPQQPRPHTPLQNAAMGSSTSSLQSAPVIRVNLPHGQHTKVSLCVYFMCKCLCN